MITKGYLIIVMGAVRPVELIGTAGPEPMPIRKTEI